MIKDIVEGLFEMYETVNPFELCDDLDIKVIKSNLGKEIKGFFQRTKEEYEIIHINSEIPEEEMKYICAHELGHAILHTDMSISFFIENSLQVRSKYEVQADKFAARLLLHDLESNQNDFKGMNVSQLSAYFCVPESLIEIIRSDEIGT